MKFKINYASCDETNEREVDISDLDELAEIARIEGKRPGMYKWRGAGGGISLLISFPYLSSDKGVITVVDGYID